MNEKNKSIASRITYILIILLLCILLYFAYKYYQSNNFNQFIRSEANLYSSEFRRDNEIKYNDKASYKINSNNYNDAMFYQNIKVEKNQPYKITCMVKTDNVEAEEKQDSSIGAQISIEGYTERSVAIQGTSDWQRIELIFNSKDRTSVNLGFRLGGNSGYAKGTAWFSDFTFEEGIADNSNQWNFAYFILENTDVNVSGKQVNIKTTENDIKDIKQTINRFTNSCEELSQRKMKCSSEIYEIETPLTELSYDEEFGYYVSPENVEELIKKYIEEKNYDHIFVIMRLR